MHYLYVKDYNVKMSVLGRSSEKREILRALGSLE